MGFFDHPQGAAIFKHAVLERYVPVFAAKVGSSAPDHRVHFLDGYAGPGWYEDNSPGSPALLMQTADALSVRRNISCWFVEEGTSRFRKLRDRVDNTSRIGSVQVLKGTMAEHLPEIVRAAGGDPLFAFLDPFGIGLPFDSLVGKLMHRGAVTSRGARPPKTEVLISFIYAGVNRNAGRLTQQTSDPRQLKVAEKVLPRLDANLGGQWWREIWLANPGSPGRVCTIRDRYVENVLAAAGNGWRCYLLPVPDHPGGCPVYDLLLFTRNPQGLWFFNEAVSLARGEVERIEAGKREAVSTQLQLWIEAESWVEEIEANLVRLLPVGGHPIRVLDEMYDVYGRSLGFARGMHVRKAVERLHSTGVIINSVKGRDVHKFVLIPCRAVQTA